MVYADVIMALYLNQKYGTIHPSPYKNKHPPAPNKYPICKRAHILGRGVYYWGIGGVDGRGKGFMCEFRVWYIVYDLEYMVYGI